MTSQPLKPYLKVFSLLEGILLTLLLLLLPLQYLCLLSHFHPSLQIVDQPQEQAPLKSSLPRLPLPTDPPKNDPNIQRSLAHAYNLRVFSSTGKLVLGNPPPPPIKPRLFLTHSEAQKLEAQKLHQQHAQ